VQHSGHGMALGGYFDAQWFAALSAGVVGLRKYKRNSADDIKELCLLAKVGHRAASLYLPSPMP
jgi:hypothetical protein